MMYKLRHIISGKTYMVSAEHEQNAIDMLAAQLGVKGSDIDVVRNVVSLNLIPFNNNKKK